MDLAEVLETLYKIYESDIREEDKPPTRPHLDYKEGDIVELKGNIYIFLWKKEGDRWKGLLATPYTLLAHPTHPRVKTDSLLYEVMAITDLYIPLTEETIKKYLTDRIRVLEDRTLLEEKIEQSLKRKKVYHPIREKFMKNEARRTAFLLEEHLQREFQTTDDQREIVIRIPKEVLEKVEIPQRLAADSVQETAENENFLIVQEDKKLFKLIVKDNSLLGQEVRILLDNHPLYKGILKNPIISIETENEISPSSLADLIKLEV